LACMVAWMASVSMHSSPHFFTNASPSCEDTSEFGFVPYCTEKPLIYSNARPGCGSRCGDPPGRGRMYAG
jgi:hypothetical protein